MDMFNNMFNNFWQQLDTLGQEKLELELDLAECRGWWRTPRINMRGVIKVHADMKNEFVLIRKNVDKTYLSKVELKSHLDGLTNEIIFLRQLYEEEIHDL